MAQLKDLLVTGDSRIIGNNYNNNPKVAYGTCTTAAATAAKVVVIDDPTWNLQIGDIIGVKFTNTNSASSCTLNVNSTGAKSLWYNNAAYTGSSNMICGYANRYVFYMYDGTYWVWLTYGNENSGSDTYPSAYCSTGAGTAAKTATCTNYQLLANSYLHIVITNANTSATALTLNVNGKGAKPIYINGTATSTSNYTLPAGSYICYYNGTNYYFRTDGKLTASITGDAATVNGKTVAVNVPADAKFTDNNTTYTFANGTNGFTVTPSGGSAQTVTVTPSITNNVTGSGTSGYIAKFNGANTITSGPQLGSSTTTYLRNDGSWVDPRNVYVGSSAPSGSNYDVWIDTNGTNDLTALINAVYPVNSIYMSTSSTNPGTTFGVGTWVPWGQGKVPVGVDPNDSDFKNVEAMGGQKSVKLSANIGACNNGTTALGYITEGPTAYQGIANPGYIVNGAANWTFSHWNHSTAVTEFNSTNRNTYILQPYITCYMWKRTA